MKLKKLELVGFKSFVNNTVINFDKDITAIVGPNGCGKSNILDAIRWVMGEQSSKMLRGRAMEDVIFAGSEARAPYSMASVELTFSTEGYQTPVEYASQSEISICRRLYRTGESEYLINKVAVRLKDITDLFLGTGIGTKAYSMIEQGKVNTFIMAKPEERRYFIEEAAGISKFKSRKEMALRKIEATRQNILRLTDLVTELERQLGSLDRQAKKAEKFREVKTEYVALDLSVLSYNYQKHSKAQDEHEAELKVQSEKEISLKSGLLELENQQEQKRIQLLEDEKEIQNIQNDVFELTNSIQLVESRLKYQEEEKKRFASRLQQISVLKDDVYKQISTLGDNLFAANEQLAFQDLEAEQIDEDLLVTGEFVAQGQIRITDVRSALDQMKEEIFRCENRLLQIKTIKESIEKRSAELAHGIETDQQELERIRELELEARKVYQMADESLGQLRQMKLNLNQRTDEITGELGDLRNNLRKEETELLEMRDKLAHRKSRLASLEELQRNFEGYQEGTRSVLRKKREEGLDGIFGTVAEMLDTQPEYEGAVSAVLGEKLQYVVVKSQAEGLAAVDYLRGASAGRSSFVPMEVRSYEGQSGDIPVQEGVLGPLKNFVTLKDDFGHLSEFLFGDVVLVDNLKKAVDLWSGNGHKKTLVTLSGEVVDPTGVITGGDSSTHSNTLLAMKREIRELIQFVGQVEEEVKAKEQVRQNLSDTLMQLETSLNSVKQSYHEETVKMANQEKDVSQFKKDVDQLVAEQNELSHKVITEKQKLDDLEKEWLVLEQESLETSRMLDEYRQSFESQKIESETFLREFEEAGQKLTELKIKDAQAHERRTAIGLDMQRALNEILRLRTEAANLSAEQETIEEKVVTMDKYLEHWRKIITKRLGNKDEMTQSLQNLKSEYDQKNTSIREEEVSIKTLRQSYEDANRLINQHSVLLTEVRGEIKHLAEQCLERHQRAIADLWQENFNPDLDIHSASEKLADLKQKLVRLGDVNTEALTEYEEIKTRYEFLKKQRDDLEVSVTALEKAIHKINRSTRERFITTFNLVNDKFQALFPKMFKGGKAYLKMTDEENLLETGIEVVAQPPGKKLQSIGLLSGGEKALTALSLIFAIFQIKPSPFCILDEADAPLDEANVHRYNEAIRDMTGRTQFIVITHNKKTMEMADALYGVTMQEPGISQIVSVQMNA